MQAAIPASLGAQDGVDMIVATSTTVGSETHRDRALHVAELSSRNQPRRIAAAGGLSAFRRVSASRAGPEARPAGGHMNTTSQVVQLAQGAS